MHLPKLLRIALIVSASALGADDSGAPAIAKPQARSGKIIAHEGVVLGGISQAISIRGEDRRHPILLFLHGGPGLPEMPVAHLNRDLERDFVVVQWDQRGAGKSYRKGMQAGAMQLRNFVSDTEELTRWLERRFGQEKIYLAGFSWGSMIGALAAAEEPQLFRAYIGLGQLANLNRAERALYDETLAEARRRQNAAAVRELEAVGAPPYKNEGDKPRAKKWIAVFHPAPAGKITALRFAWLALTSPDYSLADVLGIARGARFSHALLTPQIYATDLFRRAPQINVPVYFGVGKYDTIVSSTVAQEYFRALKAPRGKTFVTFEKSDHAVHLEEPEKYRALVRRARAETVER